MNNVENLERFIEWAERGDRSIRFEYEPNNDIGLNTEIRIWCWDKKLLNGVHKYLHEFPPTEEEIMETERENLEKRLKKIKEMSE